MNQKIISSGSAVAAQAMTILFFTPFTLLVAYIIISKRFDLQGILILTIEILIAFVVIRGSLTYADIYIDDNSIISKKIIGSKTRTFSEVRSLNKAIVPTVYRIDFNDNKRVYFMMNLSDVFKQLTNNESSTALNFLKSKINQ